MAGADLDVAVVAAADAAGRGRAVDAGSSLCYCLMQKKATIALQKRLRI